VCPLLSAGLSTSPVRALLWILTAWPARALGWLLPGSDTALLKDIVTATIAGGFTGLLMLGGVVVMMGLIDAVLLGVAAATRAVAGVLMGLATRRINRSATLAQQAVGAVSAGLERMFASFRTVKASGAEEREEARLRSAVRGL
jgi:ABC-type multidrug transport system fused ATPase/permease subunit